MHSPIHQIIHGASGIVPHLDVPVAVVVALPIRALALLQAPLRYAAQIGRELDEVRDGCYPFSPGRSIAVLDDVGWY